MLNNNPGKRDPSCDFGDIDEGEGREVATPVNQSMNKMDVESLLKKSKETRERIKYNLDRGSIRDSSGHKYSESATSKNIVDDSKSIPFDSPRNLHADVDSNNVSHKFREHKTVDVDLQESDYKAGLNQNVASPKYDNLVS